MRIIKPYIPSGAVKLSPIEMNNLHLPAQKSNVNERPDSDRPRNSDKVVYK